MLTFQDLQKVGDREQDRLNFVKRVIAEHKSSNAYAEASIAKDYCSHRNRTIINYQKLLNTMSGAQVPDNYSANYKIASGFFERFVTQENQFLLGNGVSWTDPETKDKLGTKRYPFDTQLQELGKEALVGGVAFGFWNLDHIECFSLIEFAPLYDEENGALSAGVRFWQVAEDKPLRATLYEPDGYTEIVWDKTTEGADGKILKEKTSYKVTVATSVADGTQIYDGENYPTFPIVPLWGNPYKQSELIGFREQIDAYDLIKSGFADDVDDASQIYWIMQNAGGMDEVDLAKFLNQIKRVKAAVVEDGGAHAEPHTMDVPYESRETLLSRLERDMYKDFMAFNPEIISSGAVTATQIKAAYEPINNKADQYEYCVLRFVQGILELAGVDDQPTFTRSMIVNASEEIEMVLQAAQVLDADYVTKKVLNLLGDAEKADEMVQKMSADEMNRFPTEGEEEV